MATTKEYKFTIKIKGTATYSSEAQKLDPCDVLKFTNLADGYIKMYHDEIKKMFESMTPVYMNPIIDGEFFFDGVEDEARE